MNEPRDNEPIVDDQVVEQAKRLFDTSVDRLDAATLSRLNQARHVALEQTHRSRSGSHWLRWIPVTGVAAAVLVTVMVMRGPSVIDVPSEQVFVSDFELLLDDESLEMLEDLEFYSWLDTADLETNGDVG